MDQLNKQFKKYIKRNNISKSMPAKLKKAIKSYLAEDNRVNKMLNYITPLLHDTQNPVQEIRKRIKETENPIKLFKALMLIHVAYLRDILECKAAIGLISTIKQKKSSKMHLKTVVSRQIIPKYKLYLQMCFRQKIEQKQQKNPQVEQLTMTTKQKMYQKLNLLKYGVNFTKILYLMGRYYRTKYPFIIDFNVVLAKDIQSKYNQISGFVGSDKLAGDQVLREKIEMLHENMYEIYYNCYYSGYCRMYLPKWIETDGSVPAQQEQNQASTRISQLLSEFDSMSSTAMKQKVGLKQQQKTAANSKDNTSPQFSEQQIMYRRCQELTYQQLVSQFNPGQGQSPTNILNEAFYQQNDSISEQDKQEDYQAGQEFECGRNSTQLDLSLFGEQVCGSPDTIFHTIDSSNMQAVQNIIS